ncbi:MAG: DUF374 domain-containing protein [Desulfobacteraceae bacterium]|nr:MAG: DUF374 domain-containing protein [Desulfobacteraceae bacterium]
MRKFGVFENLLLQIIPPLTAALVKALMLTCRVVDVKGEPAAEEAVARSGGSAVYTTWHQRMAYFSRYFRDRRITILISGSRDGEYAARIAARLGFDNVRGSSSRGGTKALREIIRTIKNGGKGGFFADGPQGPPRTAKMGAVLAARDAQVPIIPVAWGAERGWLLDSWDRFIVPKPFSRISVCFAEPIWVPPDAAVSDLETYRLLIETRLNACARWCDTRFGAEKPWGKEQDKRSFEPRRREGR